MTLCLIAPLVLGLGVGRAVAGEVWRYPVAVDGHFGLVDERGTLVVPLEFDEIRGWSDGLAAARRGGAWGFIDASGDWVIAPEWDGVGPFSEGRAPVARGWLMGVVDRDGELVVPLGYDQVGPFSEGLAVFVFEGGHGYLDLGGEVVIPPRFAYAGSFQEGLAVASEDGERLGFIDRAGEWVIEPVYLNASGFSEGLAAVEDELSAVFVRPDGQLAMPHNFDSTHAFSEGLALVRRGDGFGYVDPDGEVVIEPRYHGGGPAAEGLVPVALDGKMGFLGLDGQVRIPLDFDEVYGFEGPLSVARVGLAWGYVDQRGRWVWRQGAPSAGRRAARAFARLEGEVVAEVEVPGRYQAEVAVGECLAVFTSRSQAIDAARAHPGVELVLPRDPGGVRRWGVCPTTPAFGLPGLEVRLRPEAPPLAVVESDPYAEEAYRTVRDLGLAVDYADRALAGLVQRGAGDELPRVLVYVEGEVRATPVVSAEGS